MNKIFGFDPWLAEAIVAAALAYWVIALVPVIFATFVAVRWRGDMQRKLLFVASVMALTYGFAVALLAVFGVPIGHFMVFVAPTLRQSGYLENSLFVQAAELAVRYGSLALPPLLATVALLVTRYLAPRWNGIVSALKG
jgi:ABC-type multidrug transport system permease subunit